jgi:hypothetical protein
MKASSSSSSSLYTSTLSPTLKNVPQSPIELCPMVKEQYMKIHEKKKPPP